MVTSRFSTASPIYVRNRRAQTAEEGQIVFSGGVYAGKHTSRAASVRAKASARSGLHPLEKMPAFLRSVSKFFDTLTGRLGGGP